MARRKYISEFILLLTMINVYAVYCQDWGPVGDGIRKAYFGGSVLGFAVNNNELYVVGEFDSAGNVPSDNIAKWTGTSWNSLGQGLYCYVYGGQVASVGSYNGKIYAGGFPPMLFSSYPSGISQWDDSSWTNIGSGPNGCVDAFTVYNDELYVGGQFDSAGGYRANGIAKWDGVHWSSLGIGTNGIMPRKPSSPYGPNAML